MEHSNGHLVHSMNMNTEQTSLNSGNVPSKDQSIITKNPIDVNQTTENPDCIEFNKPNLTDHITFEEPSEQPSGKLIDPMGINNALD